MARRKSTQRPASRGSGKKSSSGKNKNIWVIVGCVAAIAIIGIIIWRMIDNPDYEFRRADLDKFATYPKEMPVLNNGAGVYLDMSDGMNFAYATPDSKLILQGIINKLAAENVISFNGLADGNIFPLEMTHTALYNYLLNQTNYQKQRAPIEETLKVIYEKKQPALLLTDYEEYKGGVIEKAAYAKRYFTDWIAEGYNIYFYKYPFVEKGKGKNMFITVFDDNAERLNTLVATALQTSGTNIIEEFVLAGKDFAFPMKVNYENYQKGGGYHNANGVDAVTNIQEKGGPEDYYNYSQPYAESSGKGGYAPLNQGIGPLAEYYPIGVSWKEAVDNARAYMEVGGNEIPFTHLLSKLYINLKAQNGYTIEDIEARAFDMSETIKLANDSIPMAELIDRKNPEVTVFLTASKEEIGAALPGWEEIKVDFDANFHGVLPNHDPKALYRVNIMISKATPNIQQVRSYFSWGDNPSLADSVIETLTAPSSNPKGRILYTYYLRSLGE